ncbi:hypothetical protein EMEDMD4_1070002 [Sinorhizobium medicae]|uniref:Uncharacterized protein n=1 Tax=Sinorhizobium medicae TaxID=110321 RepID=A0A508WPM0_9HYPH|nr:hypothetical protein EMEDMD4_1070002 [Sinorhizobium medicae]
MVTLVCLSRRLFTPLAVRHRCPDIDAVGRRFRPDPKEASLVANRKLLNGPDPSVFPCLAAEGSLLRLPAVPVGRRQRRSPGKLFRIISLDYKLQTVFGYCEAASMAARTRRRKIGGRASARDNVRHRPALEVVNMDGGFSSTHALHLPTSGCFFEN